MIDNRGTLRRKTALIGMMFLLASSTGCSLQEALVDGLFGGISDTVAAFVSGAALDAVGGNS